MPTPEKTVTRYQVRLGTWTWTHKGPDLWRDFPNSVQELKNILGPPDKLVKPAIDKGKGWVECDSKAEVMDIYKERWDSESFKVSEMRAGERVVVAVAKRTTFPYLILPHCSPGTSLVHSLIQAKFPGVKFAGGYVWKQVSGSSSWSDHAWGTAVDESQNLARGVKNDEVFEWSWRMAAEGCMKYDYALGSKNGRVLISHAPGFQPQPSSAGESHLWHVHWSVEDHDGKKPPREGGVF